MAEQAAGAIAAVDSTNSASVSATVGAASHPVDAATRDGLVAAADRALCWAKAASGNRVAAAETSLARIANADASAACQSLRWPTSALSRTPAMAPP